jgi:uncharacterized membrane protein YbhN (UPF0104 family)
VSERVTQEMLMRQETLAVGVSGRRRGLGSGIVLALKCTLFAAVCYFVARYVARHVDALTDVPAARLDWLGVACLLGGLSSLVIPLALRQIIRAHGLNVLFHRAVGLYYLPMLGKYVPGKIWSIVGVLYWYPLEGIPQRIALTSVTLLMVLALSAGMLVSFLFGTTAYGQEITIWLVPVLVGAILLATSPRVMYPTLNRVLRRLRRQEIETQATMGHIAIVLLLMVMYQVSYGVAFVCLAKSFVSDISASATMQLVGLFAFAQIAGFLAFFAPAGIGVREGVLIAGLTPVVGPGAAIVISGVSRLWQTALELLMAGMGWMALRHGRKGAHRQAEDGLGEPQAKGRQPASLLEEASVE